MGFRKKGEKNLAGNTTMGGESRRIKRNERFFPPSSQELVVLPRVVKGKERLKVKVVGTGEFDWEQKRSGDWVVSKSLKNARLAILKQGYVCSYNEFQEKYLIEGQGELSDVFCVEVRREILDTYDFDPGKDNVRDALEGLCLANRFNPVVEYFDRLEWDGEPRLDGWLIRYLGAPDNALNRVIGRKVLCAMVRRGKFPGCKFDHCMVLEGPEGILKSSAVAALVSGVGKEYYSDMGILASRDSQRQELTKGILAYELGELKGIRKADAEDVKQFITRVNDRGRAAYGRYVKEQLRTCIFIGTTNDQEYLVSQTGNRRWWPVECGVIDLEGLKADIDQLLAEAVIAEADEELFIPVELWAEAKALQDSRRYRHIWEDLLTGLEDNPLVKRAETEGRIESRIHTATILSSVLGLSPGQMNDGTNKRLSEVMQKLGWSKSKTVLRIGKDVKMGYTKPILMIAPPAPPLKPFVRRV